MGRSFVKVKENIVNKKREIELGKLSDRDSFIDIEFLRLFLFLELLVLIVNKFFLILVSLYGVFVSCN